MEKQTQRFRRSAKIMPLPADIYARHSQITTRAFLALGGSQAASSYLNTYDADLGGRPLDVAGNSPAGFEVVEAALASKAQTDIGAGGQAAPLGIAS